MKTTIEAPADLVDAADLFLMTERLRHLRGCNLRPGYDRTFIESVSKMDPARFTVRQALRVMKLAWTYRHQLPAGMAPYKKPLDMPRASKKKGVDGRVKRDHDVAKTQAAHGQGSLL